LSEGNHQFEITATDASDRSASASVRFTVDYTMQLFVQTPERGQRLSNRNVSVAFSAKRATGAVNYACQLDSGANVPCSSPWIYPDLPDGPHQVTITARDALDAWSSTVDFLVAANGAPKLVPVAQLSATNQQTCAVLETGKVVCWGSYWGPLSPVRNGGFPANGGEVNIGGNAIQVAVGQDHSCAVLGTRQLRCWGQGDDGQLGYGARICSLNGCIIGDDETPGSAGDVAVGGDVLQVGVGRFHTCALIKSGKVRCWGYGGWGALGYGNTNTIGDDESPANAGDVNIGEDVLQIAAANDYTCTVLTNRKVRCWGYGGPGAFSALGYGIENTIGDSESPASAGDVNVGGDVAQIAVGGHTCALLTTGAVRCWGSGEYGRLGYGNTEEIGDNEPPARAGDIDVGGEVLQIAAGGSHTCALLQSQNVRCWGRAEDLGYASASNIGDDESPVSAGDVLVALINP
jgi:alpha-tubulin suppressor-like RCC1 family protein